MSFKKTGDVSKDFVNIDHNADKKSEKEKKNGDEVKKNEKLQRDSAKNSKSKV